MEILALTTGFFAGTSVMLALGAYFVYCQYRKMDRERMKWTNKALVREGQVKIFSDAEIEEQEIESAPSAPRQMVSPFNRRLHNVRQRIDDEKKQEAGSKLPDDIKGPIVEAAEKRRNAG